MFKLKSLGLSIIAASIIIGNQALASIPTSVLNDYTDSYFWNVRPELVNQKIQSHQTQYQKEWSAMREVLRERLVWMELPYCYAEPGTYGYEVQDYGDTVRALTDAVFYARHPELKGRKIRAGETKLIREWNQIKQMFPMSFC